jgi:hypothetical protein
MMKRASKKRGVIRLEYLRGNPYICEGAADEFEKVFGDHAELTKENLLTALAEMPSFDADEFVKMFLTEFGQITLTLGTIGLVVNDAEFLRVHNEARRAAGADEEKQRRLDREWRGFVRRSEELYVGQLALLIAAAPEEALIDVVVEDIPNES